jgi:hypothetical protein
VLRPRKGPAFASAGRGPALVGIRLLFREDLTEVGWEFRGQQPTIPYGLDTLEIFSHSRTLPISLQVLAVAALGMANELAI